MSLKGRKALVTGASRGIGAAIADALLRSEVEVLATARSMESLSDVMSTWRMEELPAHAVVCDMANPDAGEQLLTAVEATLGQLDILVNNAGVGFAAPLVATPLSEYQHVMAVNSTSVFLTMQSFIPGMKARGYGRIINIASTASKAGTKYTAAYTASKHAVLGLTRCAAAELVGSGVTANAVCPGFVNTPMTQQTVDNIVSKTERTPEQALQALLQQAGQTRLIEPSEVAHAVLALAATEAAGINGQSLIIDGGVLFG